MGEPVFAPSAAAGGAPEEGAIMRRISMLVLVLVASVCAGLAGEESHGCCVGAVCGE
jgi:hypothetical protein